MYLLGYGTLRLCCKCISYRKKNDIIYIVLKNINWFILILACIEIEYVLASINLYYIIQEMEISFINL